MDNKKAEQIHKALELVELTQVDASSVEEYKIIISNIENIYKICIPEEFKCILQTYDDLFFDYDVEYTSIEKLPMLYEGGLGAIDCFFSLKDNKFEKMLERYYGRVPNSLLPIGECIWGDLICIGVSGENLGKIYLWDHENELEANIMAGYKVVDNNINNYFSNIYLIAETLLDFIDSWQVSE